MEILFAIQMNAEFFLELNVHAALFMLFFIFIRFLTFFSFWFDRFQIKSCSGPNRCCYIATILVLFLYVINN